MNVALSETIGGRTVALAPLRLGLLLQVQEDLPVLLGFFERAQAQLAARKADGTTASLADALSEMPKPAELAAIAHVVRASAEKANDPITDAEFSALVDALSIGDGLSSLISACSTVLASSGVTGAEASGDAATGEADAPAPSTFAASTQS